MRKVVKSVDIHAPVERVWEFVTRPENLPIVWPSMVSVSNVKRDDGTVREFDWEYKMAGLHFNGHSTTIDSKPKQFAATRSEGGVPSTFRWTYEPQRDTMTRLTCEWEYEVPVAVPIIGKIAEAAIAGINEHELDTLLGNAKKAIEAQPPAQTQPQRHA